MTTKAPAKDAVTHKYKQDLATVFKEMTSEDYLINRAYWVKEVDPEAKVEWNGDLPTITLQRWVLRDYPKFLKKLFPPKQGMGEVEKWEKDGSNWKGSYVIDVQGNPVEVTGEFTLKSTPDGGSEFSIIHGVTAKIPLLGGKIEARAQAAWDPRVTPPPLSHERRFSHHGYTERHPLPAPLFPWPVVERC